MNPPALLDELRANDVQLIAEGNCLRYDGPSNVLTPEVLSAVAAHKAELLTLLAPKGFEPQPDIATEEAAAHQAQLARLAAVFPDAVQLDGGDWRINGATYDHDNGVLLAAHTSGTTTNGYPASSDAGQAVRDEQDKQQTQQEAA